MQKLFMWVSITIGSSVGGWLGSLLGHNNILSWQAIVGGALGAFLGIFVGYKANQYIA